MAEQVIKIPDETLQEVKNLQQQYIQVLNQLGEIEIAIKNLKRTKEDLLSRHENLKTNEQKLIEDIGKKYGFGRLNLEKGELIVNIDENAKN